MSRGGAAQIRALFASEACARARTLSVDEAAAEVERLVTSDGTAPSIAEATEALYASARAQADDFEGELAGYVAHVSARLDAELERAARSPLELSFARLEMPADARLPADFDTSDAALAGPLARQLEPTNPPHGFHLNVLNDDMFEVRPFGDFAALVRATAAEERDAVVALDTRVRPRTALDAACVQLARGARLSTICPPMRWKLGPPGGTAAGCEDTRYYLILGARGALTPTHLDLGTQAVLYHTVSGAHKFMGMPRRIAALVHAAREGACLRWGGDADAPLLALEAQALAHCAARGLLVVDAFAAGETLLILPRGGHAVLTGERKCVLAGEWHLRPRPRRSKRKRAAGRARKRAPARAS